MNFPAFPLSKTGRSTLFFSALLQALLFSSCASAADDACDGFVGNFANNPHEEVQLKIQKEAGGYAVLVEGDSPGSWERMPLETGLSAEMKEKLLAEDAEPIVLTCALRAEGLLLLQFPAGSPSNPSASATRQVSKYPQETPYVMVTYAGFVSGESGLYRVTADNESESWQKTESSNAR